MLSRASAKCAFLVRVLDRGGGQSTTQRRPHSYGVRFQWLRRSPLRIRHPWKPAFSDPLMVDKSQIRFRAAVAHDALGKAARDGHADNDRDGAHRQTPPTIVLCASRVVD